MPGRLILCLTLLFVLMLPACDRREEAPARAGAESPARLKVSTLAFLSFGPLFIAEEEGYFAEQGLQVEFVDLRRTQYGTAALAAGQLDVLAGGMTAGVLNSIARGADVRFVADRCHVGRPGQQCTWFGVLARPEILEGNVLRPNTGELQVATPINVIQGLMLDRLVADAGLPRESVTVRFVQYPALPEAVASGATDVAIVGEPWLTRILDTGRAKLWAAGEDLIPEAQIGAIAFGPRLLNRDRDLGRRFMVANLKGVRQYNRGKTERNLNILGRRTGLERDLLERLCWPNLRDDGMLNLESVMQFQTWANKRGLLERRLEPEEFWDPAFVEYAGRRLPAPGPTAPQTTQGGAGR